MKIQNRAQKGFTLIELLLVLAIIAAIGVAAFIIYPRVQAGRSASSNAAVLSSAAATVNSLFPSARYSNLTPAVAYNSDVFPDSMKGATAGTFTNEWGNAVTIIGSTAAGVPDTTAAARYFTIQYYGVPKNVCAKLAAAAAANFGRVAIGTVSTNIAVNEYAGTPVPLNEATIATGCASGTGGSVDMFFTTR